jgi:DNA-binding transcriptional LysR family regulator
MTLVQLHYVFEAYKAGSITKAANNCFVSQSVLSTAISKLEAEIGRSIFSRSANGVSLTPFGKTFIEKLIPLLEDASALEKIVTFKKGTRQKTLRIASSGWWFISKIISRIINNYEKTGVRIEYYEILDNDVMQMVSDRSAEVGFIRRYTCHRSQNQKACKSLGLQFYPIVSAELGVTVSPKNPLYYHPTDYITPEMLQNSTLIVWNYSDEVLISDLFHRLKLPQAHNRVIVNARASVDEILQDTDSYYLDTVFQHPKLDTALVKNERTLILKDCGVKSEFGWLKRKDVVLNDYCTDFVNAAIEFCNESILS